MACNEAEEDGRNICMLPEFFYVTDNRCDQRLFKGEDQKVGMYIGEGTSTEENAWR